MIAKEAQIPEAKYEHKFFKFKIEKLLTKLRNEENEPVTFNESQWAMVHGVEENRFYVHIAGRRTGKSFAAAVLAFTKMLEPNSRVAIVSPTFTLSGIIWEFLTKIIRDLGIETTKFSEKDRVVVLSNGSSVRLLSTHNRISLVGRGYHLVIIDEAALMEDDQYFNQDIRPTLSTFANTKCLFISTPRGKHNYLYEYYNRAKNDVDFPDWGSGVFTWRSNPRLKKEEIETARKTMPKALFEQEYECSWTSFENMVYSIPPECLIDNLYETQLAKRKIEIIGGLDMGYRDQTAFVVVATDYKKYYIIDEYVINETVTSTIAKNVKDLQLKYDIQNIYIDSQAQQTKADLANDYDVYCDNAVKAVPEGIANIQNLFEKELLLIDPINCPNTLAALEQYKWSKTVVKPTPVHDISSHCCDAVRYCIYTHQKSQVGIYSA